MKIEDLEARLNRYEQKLKDDPDYQMTDKMQEEYYSLKHDLADAQNEPHLWESPLLPKLVRKFKQISGEYENPDDVIDSTLKMMYPETDGEFDLDEWED